MNKKKIIEKVKDCKLVYERSFPNGHDCWGNSEYYTRQFVRTKDGEVEVFDDMLVMHDGKNVKEALYDWQIEDREEKKKQDKLIKEHLEQTGFETPREYAAYLKGKKETKTPTAYEFHNMDTGHCYVDYISHPEMGEAEGYTRKPLYE